MINIFITLSPFHEKLYSDIKSDKAIDFQNSRKIHLSPRLLERSVIFSFVFVFWCVFQKVRGNEVYVARSGALFTRLPMCLKLVKLYSDGYGDTQALVKSSFLNCYTKNFRLSFYSDLFTNVDVCDNSTLVKYKAPKLKEKSVLYIGSATDSKLPEMVEKVFKLGEINLFFIRHPKSTIEIDGAILLSVDISNIPLSVFDTVYCSSPTSYLELRCILERNASIVKLINLSEIKK